MGKRIFEVAGASDDEVEEIRALLEKEQIPYYETPRGNWGMSMAALWVSRNKDYQKAYKLIDDYQKQQTKRTKGRVTANKLELKYVLAGALIFVVTVWMLLMGYGY